MAADLDERHRSRATSRTAAGSTLNVGGPVLHGPAASSTARTTGPTSTRDNRANLYGELPLREHAQRGLRQADVHADAVVLVNVSYRDSSASTRATCSSSNAVGDDRHGQRGAAADRHRRRLVGHQPAAASSTFKYTALREPDAGPAGQHRRRHDLHRAVGTRLDIASLDTQGLLTVPAPVAGQTAYNAFIQPLIDRYGYVARTACASGGGTVGFGRQFDDDDFFRDAGQVGYNLTLGTTIAPRPPRRLPALHRLGGPDAQLQRLGRRSPCPGGRLELQRHADLLSRARSSSRRRAPSPPIHSEYQSQSFESTTRSAGATGRSTSACSRATTRSSARACARTPSTLSGFVLAPGNKYKMYEIPFSKMIQPRARRDLGATTARTRSTPATRKYNPAASSLPRAASWDRNLATTFIDAHFDAERRALRHRRRSRRRPASCSCDDLTPRTVDEFLVGTARQFDDQLVGARSTAATARAATSGRTPTTTRASPSTRRPASRASSTSRTSPRGSRRSAAARPT